MSAAVEIDLVVSSPLWDAVPEAGELVRRAVHATFASAPVAAAPGAELAVVLSDDAAVRELNRTWRGIDAPTNVLTFPAVEPEEAARAPLLGDVVLGFERVAAEAAAEGKPIGSHLAHLVVHGVLHIFGFDHLAEDEAERMEALERRALERLGIPDPYTEHAQQGGSRPADGRRE